MQGGYQWGNKAQGCRIRPGRAALGLWFRFRASRAADPSGPSSGQAPMGSLCSHRAWRGPHAQEGEQRGRGQHVPSAGSAQGAQVDQDTEQGQGSARWQQRGPPRPLATRCSHGAAASSTAVGPSSAERTHEVGWNRAQHGRRWCCRAPQRSPRAGGCSGGGRAPWTPFPGQPLPSPCHHGASAALPQETSDFGFLSYKPTQRESSSQVASEMLKQGPPNPSGTPQSARVLSGDTGMGMAQAGPANR